MKFYVNSKALCDKMAQNLMTPTILAEKMQVTCSVVYRLVKQDVSIRPTTALKLREIFGDEVVYVK